MGRPSRRGQNKKIVEAPTSGKVVKSRGGRGGASAVTRGGAPGLTSRGGHSGRGAGSARGARGAPGRGGRGASRGKGRYASPPRVPLIVPNLPPLYPPVSYLKPLGTKFRHLIPCQKYTRQYFRSNYKVKMGRKHPSPFRVEKYTDIYSEPLRVPEQLRYQLDHDLIPPGLTQKVIPKVERREITDLEIRQRLEMRARREKANNEIDMSEGENSDDEITKRKTRRLDDYDEDEDGNEDKDSKGDEQEEDPDEELDEGNDYLLNYFDNGEGNSDEDIDDPNVY